jgi:pimeloyl-ACP methyl ester carboxylesterase
VLRYDARGYGRSSLPGGPFSHERDLDALLDVAGIERVALVSASFGSAVALELALLRPDRVSALVIAPPGIVRDERSELLARADEREEALLDAGDIDGAVELNVELWVGGPNRPLDAVDATVVERMRAMQRRALEIQVPAYVREPAPGPWQRSDPPARERLREIRAPALVLVGEHDVEDILASADELDRSLPDARKHVLTGAAHMLNMELPAEFNRLVLDFLAEHGD